jgi:hypothetical protein
VRRWLVAAVTAGALVSVTAVAQDDEGVRHFRTGVRLYKDGNFVGALAEFEEANRLHQTASALQNIALCQKALFRYAEAVATLERMLAKYGTSLSEDDARAARDTIVELRGLVTHVTLVIEPATAAVTVDGHPVSGGAERKIDLDVGEHRVVVEAPRHRRYDQVLSIAGREKTVEVRLEADLGEITVVVDDPEAAIAVDGSTPLAYGTWTGKVTAGDRHVVTAYKPGYDAVNLDVLVAQGEARTFQMKLGARSKGLGAPAPFTYVRPPAPLRRGPYGFLSVDLAGLSNDPDHFVLPSGKDRSGTIGGARVGWLLTGNLGIEGMIEGGKQTVGAGCYTTATAPTCDDALAGQTGASYSLQTVRAGANGRYISNGATWRFVGIMGVGAVSHTLDLHYTSSAAKPESLPQGSSTAINGYLRLEAGAEVSIGPVLVDGVLSLTVDGVSNLKIDNTPVYTTRSQSLSTGGVGLRVGYALW